MPPIPLSSLPSPSALLDLATHRDPLFPHVPRVDPTGWRLLSGEDSHGQHKWVYLSEDDPRRREWGQSEEEKYWLGLEMADLPLPTPTTPLRSASNGYTFYKRIQSPDGHWAGEYGGPLFLIPGVVIGLYVMGFSLRPEQVLEMRRYLMRKRKPDGGWGLHEAAPATMFGTLMNYVVLRILGLGPDVPEMIEIRALIHKMGGGLGVPSWGKAWLAILGVYGWEGLNPVPPELWLLPDWVPFHPHRWWIHTRNVCESIHLLPCANLERWMLMKCGLDIPMGYLYGIRWVGPITPLVLEIREEIYTQPYSSINFSLHRNTITPVDLYAPHHPVLNVLNEILAVYEKLPTLPSIPSIRRRALKKAYQLVVWEDENTGFQTLAPVSKMFNMLVRYVVDGPSSAAFASHLSRIDDVLWLGPCGLMCTGTNGSQLWDLAFVAQAVVETGLAEREENRESVKGMLGWLDGAQIREDPVHGEKGWRHRTKGAWGFSTPEQGYTVSDCAAEGMKAVLGLQSLSYTSSPVTPRRLKDCIDTILTMQNPNGGFASYELVRGGSWMEWLNCAEVFGNIMIEYTYPECTTSALSGLLHFSKLHPDYRRAEIERVVAGAIRYIHNEQRPDGSWFGSWGICFTYATMFALESLSLAGETCATSERVRRACGFLVGKQMLDGGWGETYMSCVTGEYAQHDQSQVVQTAWCVLSLMYAKYEDKEVIRRAVKLIMSRQQPNGEWLQEDVEGIFNKNCGINYPNFKFSFTIWALGKADAYLKE